MKTVLVWLALTTTAWAGQVCIDTSRNVVLDYQSHATPGTCLSNAAKNGITTVEERNVTPAEWEALKEVYLVAPAREKDRQRKQALKAKMDALQAKLGLTNSELQTLKESLKD